jgi:hypothetical protein
MLVFKRIPGSLAAGAISEPGPASAFARRGGVRGTGGGTSTPASLHSTSSEARDGGGGGGSGSDVSGSVHGVAVAFSTGGSSALDSGEALMAAAMKTKCSRADVAALIREFAALDGAKCETCGENAGSLLRPRGGRFLPPAAQAQLKAPDIP